MKAVVYHEYGSPDVLELVDIEKPAPADDEVLIRVQAASLNDWDWGLLQGIPFITRLNRPNLYEDPDVLGLQPGHVEGAPAGFGRHV